MILGQTEIDDVKNKLVGVYDPLEIYIFGSYAWGQPTRDSDLDLLVVVEKSDQKSYKRPISGYRALTYLDFPNEIIVFTKSEFEKYSGDITRLCYKVKVEGKKIYAKS